MYSNGAAFRCQESKRAIWSPMVHGGHSAGQHGEGASSRGGTWGRGVRAGRPMTDTDAPSRQAWIERGRDDGIRGWSCNPAIAPAPPRRPGGCQVSAERVPEARSHTPDQHGLWDRASVTKGSSRRSKDGGAGTVKVCSLEVRVMEVIEKFQGGCWSGGGARVCKVRSGHVGGEGWLMVRRSRSTSGRGGEGAGWSGQCRRTRALGAARQVRRRRATGRPRRTV